MEVIKNLLLRFRQSGTLVLVGFFVIIYIAFGFVYWQQGSEQKGLEEQTAKISVIVTKKLPDKKELQAKYDDANRVLTMTDVESSDDENITMDAKAIAILVAIAEKSGIDINPDNDKLRIPPTKVSEAKVGEGKYQVFSFVNIYAQGDYDSVMAFISDLDSGVTQETMVLTKVDVRQIEIPVVREEVVGEGGEEGSEEDGEEEVRIEFIASMDVDLYTKPGG